MAAYCDSSTPSLPDRCHNNAASVWVLGALSGKIIGRHTRAAHESPEPARVGHGVRCGNRCTRHRQGLGSVRGDNMAAMKPRTGDGPLEVTKEGRGIVMRVPLEGGGRLVVEMTPDEANALSEALKSATG